MNNILIINVNSFCKDRKSIHQHFGLINIKCIPIRQNIQSYIYRLIGGEIQITLTKQLTKMFRCGRRHENLHLKGVLLRPTQCLQSSINNYGSEVVASISRAE